MSRGRYWYWRTNRFWWIALPCFGAASVLFGAYLWFRLPDRGPSVALIIAGTYFVLRYWITSLQFGRLIKKHPQFNQTLTWTFSEEGAQLESEHATLKADWNLYLKSYTTPDGFLLFPQKRIFNWIPRSGFSSDEDARVLEDILARKTRNQRI